MSNDRSDYHHLSGQINDLIVSQGQTNAKITGLETRFDVLDERSKGLDDRIGQVGEKIDLIHTKIAGSGTDIAWIKRIVFVVMTAIAGGSGLFGISQAISDDPTAKAAIVEELKNGMDTDGASEDRGDRVSPEQPANRPE